MSCQTGLSPADLAHEHPLPKTEVEADEEGHPSRHQVERIADDVGRLDGAGRR
jgi:hypothetical protein